MLVTSRKKEQQELLAIANPNIRITTGGSKDGWRDQYHHDKINVSATELNDVANITEEDTRWIWQEDVFFFYSRKINTRIKWNVYCFNVWRNPKFSSINHSKFRLESTFFVSFDCRKWNKQFKTTPAYEPRKYNGTFVLGTVVVGLLLIGLVNTLMEIRWNIKSNHDHCDWEY